jgi:hypothetical protein
MQRISGVYFVLKLANSTLNKVWSFEKAVANMLDGRRRAEAVMVTGPQCEQRRSGSAATPNVRGTGGHVGHPD